MNCIENLRLHHSDVCEPCIWNGKIIEFEELPEEQKFEFCDYDKDSDFLLHCKKCQVYFLIPSIQEEQKQ